MRQSWGVVLLIGVTLCGASPAQAQSAEGNRGCNGAPASPLVSGTLRGMVRMPDKGSLAILGAGAGAALAAHQADTRVSEAFRDDPDLRPVFKPGATLGGMP